MYFIDEFGEEFYGSVVGENGSIIQNEYYDLTKEQLDRWGCKYHDLSTGEKPDYDLLICDKTKRIEEI